MKSPSLDFYIYMFFHFILYHWMKIRLSRIFTQVKKTKVIKLIVKFVVQNRDHRMFYPRRLISNLPKVWNRRTENLHVFCNFPFIDTT